MSYQACDDHSALEAFDLLARTEGIIPALESSHAISSACKIAAGRSKDDIVLVCLSGRGEKDAAEIERLRASDENSPSH